jgi:hypothetical protein
MPSRTFTNGYGEGVLIGQLGFVQGSTTFNGGFGSRRRQKEKAPGRMSFPRGLASLVQRGNQDLPTKLYRTATLGVPGLKVAVIRPRTLAASCSHSVLVALQTLG